MAKSSTPALIRKSLSEVAQLITDPRLPAALSTIGTDAKLFAKAKANPKAFLAKHEMKTPSGIATKIRLSRELVRAGRKITLCIHTRYEREGKVIYDENGNAYVPEIVIEGEKCTSFIIPK